MGRALGVASGVDSGKVSSFVCRLCRCLSVPSVPSWYAWHPGMAVQFSSTETMSYEQGCEPMQCTHRTMPRILWTDAVIGDGFRGYAEASRRRSAAVGLPAPAKRMLGISVFWRLRELRS